MNLQYVLTAIVIVLCLVLTGRWVWKSLTDERTACRGCALKYTCGKAASKTKGADYCKNTERGKQVAKHREANE